MKIKTKFLKQNETQTYNKITIYRIGFDHVFARLSEGEKRNDSYNLQYL